MSAHKFRFYLAIVLWAMFAGMLIEHYWGGSP